MDCGSEDYKGYAESIVVWIFVLRGVVHIGIIKSIWIIDSNDEHKQNKEQTENKPKNHQTHAYPSPNLGLLGRGDGSLKIA